MELPTNIQSAQQTSPTKNLDEKSKAKLQKAVQDFEAMFVNYLLKNMRNTVNKDEESEDGFGGEMMQGMFDYELARQVSRTSNLGVGEMLYKKITGESLPRTNAVSQLKLKNTIDVFPKEINEALPKNIVASSLKESGVAASKQSSMINSPSVVPSTINNTTRSGKLKPSKNVREAVGKYNDIINRASEKYDVDTTLIKAVMASESAGNPKAHSSANAKGLMQLIDSTASMMGVKNSWDPEQNIYGGTKYLRHLLDKFDGDVKLAVASYNAGPAWVEKHKKVPPIQETQHYVRRVMNYLDTLSAEEE